MIVMIILTVLVTRNCSEHIHSQGEKSVQFPVQTTVDNQNYPETVHKIQAINLINKLPNIIKTKNRPKVNGPRIILAK